MFHKVVEQHIKREMFLLQAYKDWLLTNNGREIQLPYKSMTNEKFFFVAFAQVYMISSILSVMLHCRRKE